MPGTGFSQAPATVTPSSIGALPEAGGITVRQWDGAAWVIPTVAINLWYNPIDATDPTGEVDYDEDLDLVQLNVAP